jgi:hypothetical protein
MVLISRPVRLLIIRSRLLEIYGTVTGCLCLCIGEVPSLSPVLSNFMGNISPVQFVYVASAERCSRPIIQCQRCRDDECVQMEQRITLIGMGSYIEIFSNIECYLDEPFNFLG